MNGLYRLLDAAGFGHQGRRRQVNDKHCIIRGIEPVNKSIRDLEARHLRPDAAERHVDRCDSLSIHGPTIAAPVEEIAKMKMKDLTAADLDAAVKTIAGSARSMGVTVEGV